MNDTGRSRLIHEGVGIKFQSFLIEITFETRLRIFVKLKKNFVKSHDDESSLFLEEVVGDKNGLVMGSFQATKCCSWPLKSCLLAMT